MQSIHKKPDHIYSSYTGRLIIEDKKWVETLYFYMLDRKKRFIKTWEKFRGVIWLLRK